jgi:hypothetical protein
LLLSGYYYLTLPTCINYEVHPSKVQRGQLAPDLISVRANVNTGVATPVSYTAVHHQIQVFNQV